MSGRPDTPWTPEQLDAIEDRGNDLIVSAAAGSGKTAVLAERVLRIITGTETGNPVPLDRLLVITFTRKAAAEMRERIERKIGDALRTDPANAALREAADMLPRSNIMTLNAFCDRLARRHFHRAGLAPTARIADEDESDEISAAATHEVIARRMRGGESPVETSRAGDMARLLACTPPRMGADPLGVIMDEMTRLRTFLASLDDPEGWTSKAREEIAQAMNAQGHAELPGMRHAARGVAQSLADLAQAFGELIREARSRFHHHAVPAAWDGADQALNRLAGRAFSLDPSALPGFLAELGAWWNTEHGALLRDLSTIKQCGNELYGERSFLELRIKPFREAVKKWIDKWLGLDFAHEIEASRLGAWRCGVMLDLAVEAEELALETRRRRGVATFADMERAALRLLRDTSGAGPSEIAAMMQDHFEHVLVDEYQDISPLQDALIRLLSRTADPSPGARRNLFIVGDLKQSIYRFRRAEPMLFNRRMTEWAAGGAQAEGRRRIDLRTNFRSRAGVLHAVNAFFSRAMDMSLGDLDYDESQRLDPRRKDPPETDQVCVEACWLMRTVADESGGNDEAVDGSESGTDGDLTGIDREAAWIARRIHALRGDSTAVIDKETGLPRPARGGDCAILVRRLARDAELWRTALARHGVRVAAAAGLGLLDQPEVIELHMALRVVDQPLEDLPLAVLLRSPMVGLDESDLLRLRMINRSGPFHQAVKAACDCSDLPSPLVERMRTFFEMLSNWRRTAMQEGPEAVLDQILRETGYEAWLAGLPGGAARIANVRALAALARGHEGRSSGMTGLGGFLRHLAEARGRAAEEEAEGAAERDEDAVRLLTIHKSKGLEFPVVFLPRLGSPFAGRPQGGLILSAEAGIAADGIDPERRLKLRPLSVTALIEAEARAQRAEELRLIYVAMTRARDRLIMLGETGSRGRTEEQQREDWIMRAGRNGVIPALTRLRAASPADLIGPVFTAMDEDADRPSWLSVCFESGTTDAGPEIELPAARAALIGIATGGGDAEWAAARREVARTFPDAAEMTTGEPEPAPILSGPPPDSPLSRVPMKIVASSLRRESGRDAVILAGDEREPNPRDPEEEDARREPVPRRGRLFRREEITTGAPRFILARRSSDGRGAVNAAARGTLVHGVLRRVDLAGELDEADLRRQAARMHASGLLDIDDPALLDDLPYDGMAWFFTTPPGRMMIERPGAVLREAPFRHWIPAAGLHEVATDGTLEPVLKSAGAGRPVLVQGVVDCIIDEGDAVTIIDYKTDRVRRREDLDRLTAHYHAQIDEYRRAISACWRIPVRSACLVFIEAKTIVDIDGRP